MVRVAGFEPTASWTRTRPANFFQSFLVIFGHFIPLRILFEYLRSRCFRVLRRSVWYVLWSETLPSPCRCLSPTGTRERFSCSFTVNFNSTDTIKQIIFAPPTAQELGSCKQKKRFLSRGLRAKIEPERFENASIQRADADDESIYRIRLSG